MAVTVDLISIDSVTVTGELPRNAFYSVTGTVKVFNNGDEIASRSITVSGEQMEDSPIKKSIKQKFIEQMTIFKKEAIAAAQLTNLISDLPEEI